MEKSDPEFEARPNHQGDDWCVHVVWKSGATDLLTGFANQYAALEWIRRKSANWAVDKIMGT
jgi:hypothetical protein